MYKLFSERIKNKDEEPEVYIYDEFPMSFRNQVFYIMEDVLDDIEWECYYWEDLYNDFCREKGMKRQNGDSYEMSKRNCETYIVKCRDENLMDFIDFAFYMFNTEGRNPDNLPHMRKGVVKEINSMIDKAIEELNYRFK